MYSLHGILAKREKKYVGEGKNEEIDSPENIFSPPFFLWENLIN